MPARKPGAEPHDTADLAAARCPHCAEKGRVTPQRVIRGGSESASWICTECEAEWTIVNGKVELVERRHGAPDRRANSRSDRRRPHRG